MPKNISLLLVLITLFAFASCKKQKNMVCNSAIFFKSLSSPYSDPVWHPSGKIIGFNHIPLKTIDYTNAKEGCPVDAEYLTQRDSSGFWLINADGTNMRRILPYQLITPAWSADGKWIAFSNGGIAIMPFDGEKFDTTRIVQLTTTGDDFSPSWNAQSTKIVYGHNICNAVPCGAWLYDVSVNTNNFLIRGGEPSWFHKTEDVLYYTTYLNSNHAMVGDTVWVYNTQNGQKRILKVISTPFVDNRQFLVSPDDSKIAFTAQSNIPNAGVQVCTINADGSNFNQLTTEGTTGFSWGPDGRIVYVNFYDQLLDQSHGVLWIMNADGSNKKQLTYNRYNTIP